MRKKIIVITLSILMILALIPILDLRAFDPDVKVDVIISTESVKAKPGDSISYSIAIGGVEDMSTLEFYFQIPTGLVFERLEFAEDFQTKFTDATGTAQHFVVTEGKPGIVLAGYQYSSSVSASIATLTCTVADGYVGNTTVTLSMAESYIAADYTHDYEEYGLNVTAATVPVSIPATGITITPTLLEFDESEIGTTKKITATVLPENATNQTVSYSSTDESVATVNASGVVTAVSQGSAIIKVMTQDGGYYKECRVNVAAPHTHDMRLIEETPSTCLKQGHNAYYQCQICQCYFKDIAGETATDPDDELKELAPHTGGTATCENPAICDICGQKYGERKPHNLDPHPEVPADHSKPGSRAYWVCLDCGQIFSDADATRVISLVDIAIPQIPHSYDDSWSTNASGHWKECECGDIKDYRDHTFELAVTEATCQAPGRARQECTVCHYVMEGSSVVLPVLAHELTKTDAVAATCYSTGHLAYWTCASCHTLFKNADATAAFASLDETTLPKVGHAFDNVWHKDDNSHWHLCTMCELERNAEEPHTFGDWTIKQAATADTPGLRQRDCTVCGHRQIANYYFTDPEEPHTHTMETVPETASTCKQRGHNAYYYCAGCKKYFKDASGVTETTPEDELKAFAPHNYDWVIDRDATCEIPGLRHQACTVCKNVLTASSESIPKLSHDLTKTNAVAATCYSTGRAEYWTCGMCGRYFKDANASAEYLSLDETVLPETEHTYAAAWSANDINHWHICTMCNMERQDMAAHSYGDWTIKQAATADTPGLRQRDCAVCGYRQTANYHITDPEEPEEPHAHTMEIVPETASTCKQRGHNAYYQCSVCEKYFKDADGATETTPGAELKPLASHTGGTATCLHAAICDNCHESYGSRAPHKLDVHEAVPTSHFAPGNHQYWECRVCHKLFADGAAASLTTLEEVTIPQQEHSYSSEWKTDANGHWKECECGDIKDYRDHTFALKSDPDATCQTPGLAHQECTICRYVMEDSSIVIPALAHELTKTDAVAATCYSTGHQAYWTCGLCGKHFKDAEASEEFASLEDAVTGMIDHTYAAAWSSNDTHHWHVCTMCNLVRSEEAEHTYGSWNVKQEATVTTPGLRQRDCTVCGHRQTGNILTVTLSSPDDPRIEIINGQEAIDEAALGNEALQTALGRLSNVTALFESVTGRKTDAANAPSILGRAEIRLVGGFTMPADGLDLTLTVPGVTAEDTIYFLLHAMPDGTWEKIEAVMGENTMTGHFDVLSPVYLIKAKNTAEDPTVEHTHVLRSIGETASTCTVRGHYAYYRCVGCGKYFKDAEATIETTPEEQQKELLAHAMEKHEASPADHFTPGSKEYWKCQSCGKLFADADGQTELSPDEISIPQIPHDYSDEWKTDGAAHWKECECGETVDRAEHTFAWVITAQATCAHTGQKHQECTVCHYVLEGSAAEIPLADHDLVKTNETAATCYAAGNKAYWTCRACGKIFKNAEATEEFASLDETRIPIREHEYDTQWSSDAYSHWHYCTICRIEKANESEHTYGDWEILKEASTTEPGLRQRTCSICNAAQTSVIYDVTLDIINDVPVTIANGQDAIDEAAAQNELIRNALGRLGNLSQLLEETTGKKIDTAKEPVILARGVLSLKEDAVMPDGGLEIRFRTPGVKSGDSMYFLLQLKADGTWEKIDVTAGDQTLTGHFDSFSPIYLIRAELESEAPGSSEKPDTSDKPGGSDEPQTLETPSGTETPGGVSVKPTTPQTSDLARVGLLLILLLSGFTGTGIFLYRFLRKRYG